MNNHDDYLSKLRDPCYYGEYSESGVDISLIKYMLSLTPLERVRRMEQHARDSQMLMEYGRRTRQTTATAGR
jgi:hypothetical protein